MIIVTGAFGFIGSQIVKGLNAKGCYDLLLVDDLTDGSKFKNLNGAKFQDYMDYEDFLEKMKQGFSFGKIAGFLHQGACSVTTEWNGRYMLKNNYDYSKYVLHFCIENKIPLMYASSAAVYGLGNNFSEKTLHQEPLNVYGYSKWLLDQYYLQHQSKISSQVVGLRYFNVYGPGEYHKGSMASVAFHWMNQLNATGVIKLFGASPGYAPGEQLRDFVYVEDIVKTNLWFLENPQYSGIFNVGTGKARTFNDLADILIDLYGEGQKQYIPFPEHLLPSYQSFTQADLTLLRQIYFEDFCYLEEGLKKYFAIYQKNFSCERLEKTVPMEHTYSKECK